MQKYIFLTNFAPRTKGNFKRVRQKAPHNNKREREDEVTSRQRIYMLARKVLVGFLIISVLNIVFSHLFTTPKMYAIVAENRDAEMKYSLLHEKIRVANKCLDEIRHRDRDVYRMLFSADSTQPHNIYLPDERYEHLQGNSDHSKLITALWRSMDSLALQIYYESISMDELQMLAKNKEQLSSAIPAIWPIDRAKLKAMYSFGIRPIHPLYGTRKFHKGVDLSCDKGVPVYAAGDAVVELTDIGRAKRGYGQQVLLNHEFGYKTRYAHLSRILVRPGQKVMRGQIIGEVGSTGGSTGPHLHYEVIYMGQEVNPVNYFNQNMTIEEYHALIESMTENADLEAE